MTGLGSLFVFGLGCLLSPCDGKVSPPPDGNKFILLPGSTVNITWSFDDVLRSFSTRIWTFERLGEQVAGLAKIDGDGDGDYSKLSSLLDFDIKKPATLVLKNVNQSYNGTYKFALSPSSSPGESEVVIFIVVAPNVTFSCLKTTRIVKGDNFTCECRGQGGNPPANVTWYKDGVQIGKTGYEEQTLSINNFGENDRGNYTCKAQSHVNAKDEKSIELDMYLKPNVTVNCSSHIIVNESKNVICECKCEDGNPPAECTWYKDNTQIGKKGIEVNKLNLSKVSREDSGIYKCVGQSHVKVRDEKKISVTVYSKPTNTDITISENSAVINMSITIMCTSEGFPEPNFTIYHNGTILVSTDSTYFIKNVTWKDAGTYKCVAKNLLGNYSDSDRLNVSRASKPTTINPSTTQVVPSSNTTKVPPGGGGKKKESRVGLIVGLSVSAVALIVLVAGLVIYCKSKGGDNKRGHAGVNPNGPRMNTNHYELEEEDHGGDAGAYDSVKHTDDGEGSQDKKKSPGDSLPPVYASVNKDNRQGNTLYASLDSEALRKPGSKKKQPETKNEPTEYASIDFMQTGKTPNADNA